MSTIPDHISEQPLTPPRDDYLRGRLVNLTAQLESFSELAAGSLPNDAPANLRYLGNLITSTGRATSDTLERWRTLFASEIQIVRQARNSIIHGVSIDHASIEGAVNVARRLLEAGMRGILGDSSLGKNPRIAAFAQRYLGDLYAEQSRLTEAVSSYQEAIQLLQRSDDSRGEAATLVRLGNAYKRQGQNEDAVAAFQKALQIYQGLADRRGRARVLAILGSMYQLNRTPEDVSFCLQ